jgi:hypothetical protein
MAMPLFDTKSVPPTGESGLIPAVEFGGKDVAPLYEAWIAADPFRDGVRVPITGP